MRHLPLNPSWGVGRGNEEERWGRGLGERWEQTYGTNNEVNFLVR